MENSEMKSQIEKTAKEARRAGQKVEINNRLPYVSIEFGRNYNQGDLFFQGEEADELLKEANEASEKFNVTPEDYILYSAQGW